MQLFHKDFNCYIMSVTMFLSQFFFYCPPSFYDMHVIRYQYAFICFLINILQYYVHTHNCSHISLGMIPWQMHLCNLQVNNQIRKFTGELPVNFIQNSLLFQPEFNANSLSNYSSFTVPFEVQYFFSTPSKIEKSADFTSDLRYKAKCIL